MARQETAAQIINDTALEVGLAPEQDVYASQKDTFIQLRGLLTTAGRELVELREWTALQQDFEIVTEVPPDTGIYDLPSDFSRMINQTGWNRSANLPVSGPLSSQVWSTLIGRNLGSTTLYVNFRLTENIIELYPSPPPDDLTISFMYISRDWVIESGGQRKDRPESNTDIVLFEPIMIVKFLKLKWLSSKQMDTTAASREVDLMFDARTGHDAGAPVLSVSGSGVGFPYLNPWTNLPDSGYGL